MSEKEKCRFIERCPMFPLFRSDAVKRIYQIHYCEGSFQSCQRFQSASQGIMPDPRLLPDGKMMPEVPTVMTANTAR